MVAFSVNVLVVVEDSSAMSVDELRLGSQPDQDGEDSATKG